MVISEDEKEDEEVADLVVHAVKKKSKGKASIADRPLVKQGSGRREPKKQDETTKRGEGDKRLSLEQCFRVIDTLEATVADNDLPELEALRRRARLGYGFTALVEGGENKMRFRVVNARALIPSKLAEMTKSFLAKRPDWWRIETAIPLLVRRQHVKTKSLVSSFFSSEQLPEIQFRKRGDPGYFLHSLGGNHRRVAYLERNKVVLERRERTEEVIQQLQLRLASAKRISAAQKEASEKKLAEAQEKLDAYKDTLADQSPWVFEVLDYGE